MHVVEAYLRQYQGRLLAVQHVEVVQVMARCRMDHQLVDLDDLGDALHKVQDCQELSVACSVHSASAVVHIDMGTWGIDDGRAAGGVHIEDHSMVNAVLLTDIQHIQHVQVAEEDVLFEVYYIGQVYIENFIQIFKLP